MNNKKGNLTEEEIEIQLESLRNQLKAVEGSKVDLESKIDKIKKLIDKLTHGE